MTFNNSQRKRSIPDTNYYPATATNARLQEYMAYKKGWLICFGMDTFWGYIFDKFPTATNPPNPNVFNITDVDVEQWAIEAQAAGVEYAILTVKSEAGHILWVPNVAYNGAAITLATRAGGFTSPYYANNNVDGYADENILTKFVQEFTSRGIEVGAYFSNSTDWNLLGGYFTSASAYVTTRYSALDYYCALVTELVADYGFTLIWADHYSTLSEYENQRFYNAVKAANPNCLVIGNDHGLTTTIRFPCDIQSTEAGLFAGGAVGHRTTARTWKGVNYFTPQEVVFTAAKNYQYYIYDASCVSQGAFTDPPQFETQNKLQDFVDEGRAYSCPILETIMVRRDGIIDATTLSKMNALTVD